MLTLDETDTDDPHTMSDMPDTTDTTDTAEWTPGRIEALRTALGLNQTQFGQMIYPNMKRDSAQVHISNKERGIGGPGPEAQARLDRLARLHDVDV